MLIRTVPVFQNIKKLNQNCNLQIRLLSSSEVKIKSLSYRKHGVPSEVVTVSCGLLQYDISPCDVLVKMLACPINPADINTIQGMYPIKPDLPAVGGGEGVGEVLVAGRESGLTKGDWVLPSRSMSGVWISHIAGPNTNWIKVRNDIDVLAAATLLINPPTAYRMLKDFVDLRPGDWVIQNGSNSGVGQAVVQIASSMDVNTINVVRDREDVAQLKQSLQALGATIVLTEEEVRKTTMWKEKKVPRPKLALNCVGGASSTELCKALERRGVHVTYGGMSMKPVLASTSHLIFKDLSLRGFWLSQWYVEQGLSPLRLQMIEELAELVARGKLRPPTNKLIRMEDYKEAMDNTIAGFKLGKYILDMRDN